MNIDYRQFYRGTTNIPLYGSGAYKKDTLVKYEFNTTDEHGNKIMDKMSKEETLQAMKDIRSQYGDSVIVEFSGDGLAALAEDRRDSMSPEDREAMEARNAAFQKDIVQIDKSLNNLPAYSGMYGADKAVASALENCGKEDRIYLHKMGKTEDEIVSACYNFASDFEKTFCSLRCFELRPMRFSENDPPHMCENLTCRGIEFAHQYILEITQRGI